VCYRGISLKRKRTPVGPYRSLMPHAQGPRGVLEGWEFSYGSGAPVGTQRCEGKGRIGNSDYWVCITCILRGRDSSPGADTPGDT